MTRVERLAEAWNGLHRRAAIFEYPIREMQTRGWIAVTDDTKELESELCRFFQASSVDGIGDSFAKQFSVLSAGEPKP